MARPNDVVAELLQEYADLISITGGETAFKTRMYEKAARAVAGYATDVSTLDAKGLQQIPNVGKSIAEKIVEFYRTGHVQAVEQLRGKVPAGVLDLTRIPGLGPKKAMLLCEDLGVTSINQLRNAIRAGRLEGHRGFGAKSAENILHGIAVLEHGQGRVLLSVATEVADEIVAALAAVPGCQRCAYAGSLRRMRETIGDIDVLAAAKPVRPGDGRVHQLPLVAEIIAHGTDEELDPHHRRVAGRPASGRARRVERRCSTSPGRRRTTSGCGRSPSARV